MCNRHASFQQEITNMRNSQQHLGWKLLTKDERPKLALPDVYSSVDFESYVYNTSKFEHFDVASPLYVQFTGSIVYQKLSKFV